MRPFFYCSTKSFQSGISILVPRTGLLMKIPYLTNIASCILGFATASQCRQEPLLKVACANSWEVLSCRPRLLRGKKGIIRILALSNFFMTLNQMLQSSTKISKASISSIAKVPYALIMSCQSWIACSRVRLGFDGGDRSRIVPI